MPALVLFVEAAPATCTKVKSFSELPASIECACLVACTSLCFFVDSNVKRGDSVLNGVLLARDDPKGPIIGSKGAVFWSHKSASILDRVADEATRFECIVSNIEGVLDEGLELGQDIQVVEALPFRHLAGLDKAFLASANLEKNGHWCFVLEINREAVQRLLNSATMGYLLGLRMKDVQKNTIARLIRCAGYDDGETDLLLSELELDDGLELLARF